MNKTGKYKLDQEKERKLYMMNDLLKDFEDKIEIDGRESLIPPTFIVGAPRTGTTLMYQILAKTGLFDYINNFNAKFWKAPKVGFLLDKFLDITDYKDIKFKSDFGRTGGLSNVHHFSRFWINVLGYNEITNRFDLETENGEKLKETLIDIRKIIEVSKNIKGGFEEIDNHGFLFKSHYCGAVIDWLREHLGRIKVIVMTRNVPDTTMSILKARRNVMGSENKWWSLKPSNYSGVVDVEPEVQVLRQIGGIEKDVYRAISARDCKRMVVSYEDLCTNFYSTMKTIFKHLYGYGYFYDRDGKEDYINKYLLDNVSKIRFPAGKYRDSKRWKKINELYSIMWGQNKFEKKLHKGSWCW